VVRLKSNRLVKLQIQIDKATKFIVFRMLNYTVEPKIHVAATVCEINNDSDLEKKVRQKKRIGGSAPKSVIPSYQAKPLIPVKKKTLSTFSELVEQQIYEPKVRDIKSMDV
jgi:hypothetical protein